MNKTLRSISLLALIFFAISCGEDGPRIATGKLAGRVTDAVSGAALESVRIIVFDANDNSPTGSTLITNANGQFVFELVAGNYFLKFYKQGYEQVPAAGMEAVPFTIEVGKTNDQSVEMFPSTTANSGYITGTVKTTVGLGGALVVAEDNTKTRAYSTVSGSDGRFAIYNIPAGSYSVKAYIAKHNSSSSTVPVVTNAGTDNVNISLTESTGGKLSGTVRNLAAGNKDVDVSLAHPLTKETIPGLTTASVNQAYTISDIPDGTYIARATYKNDERVMDPDRIAKFGEPLVSFSGNNNLELTFDVTGSVSIVSPTNEASTNNPVEVTSTTPTFTWTAYSSTSDYVIEVTDASTGSVIWGGFDKSEALPSKRLVIPSSQTSIQFNADGSASIPALVRGKSYRWRIFASKNDQNSTTGWTLISASEDQLGLIRVAQ